MPNIKRRWIWMAGGALLLLAAYIATRLFRLTDLPIFTDEAIYIRWSQIGSRDPNWRFISLTDGKQPMFTWVMMVLLRVFKDWDPLFVGRLTSVIAGLGTMIGIGMVSKTLFRSARVAWVACFLYVVMPYTVWYDRMALYDSMVSLFAIWSLYFAIHMVRFLRLDMALILGMILGGGMLNKSSGFLSMYLLPFTLVLFDWRGKKLWQRFLRWTGLVIAAALVSQVLYSVLRLSPFFHIVAAKNNVFLFSVNEWLNQPFRFFAGNLRGMFDWVREYITLPVFIAALLPLFTRWPYRKERLLLYIWWILPFMALANFAKILYPRFILFMTIPLFIIAADSYIRIWSLIQRPLMRFVLIGIFFLPGMFISRTIITDPIHAGIPLSDRNQYMNDWPAGGGVLEVVAYLREAVRHEKVAVITEGTFGLLPYAIEIYLVDNPNITIEGMWPLPQRIPDAIQKEALTRPTYLILNESQVAPSGWPLTLIGEYQKGNRADRKLRFYRISVPLARLL